MGCDFLALFSHWNADGWPLMTIEICVDLVDESGEQKAFFRAGVAEILMLLGVRSPLHFSESASQVLLLEDQRQLRASVVNKATGEVWAVALPVVVEGECECCGVVS